MMGRKALIAVLCCVALNGVSAKAVQATNSDLIDNVSAESAPQLYRNVPSGVYSYASANPYAAYSIHVPQFAAPNYNQIVPLNQERILAQSTNNYLKDSYGQRFVQAPQGYAYKAALQQQFVPLQKLPAHLSQPLAAAAPNAQYGQATHFFGSSPFRLANLQAISHDHIDPFNTLQPVVYAQNVRTLVASPAAKPQGNGQPVAQQQSTSNNNIYANIHKSGQYNNYWKEPNAQVNQEDPKISASDHKENQQIIQNLPLVHAPKQTTITSFTNGKKTVVNLITKPPVPHLLDLTLLEPLTFDNPLVPQVQHFLPKIHSVTYKKLPELNQNQKKVVTIKRKTTKKIKKQKKPKVIQEERVEVNHTPTRSAGDNPEFSHESNSPNYKETISEKKVSYNKETQSTPISISYEKKTEMKPVTYSYGKTTQKEPVHYNYVIDSSDPAQLKQAYLEDNKEKTKHLIYHFTPEELSDEKTEENQNSEPPIESVEIYEEIPTESDKDEQLQLQQHQQHHEVQQQHHEPQHQQQYEPQHQQHPEPKHQQQYEPQQQHHHEQPQQYHQPQHHQQHHHKQHYPEQQQHQQQKYHQNHQPLQQHQHHQQHQKYEPQQHEHHEPQKYEHHEPQQHQYQQQQQHEPKQEIHQPQHELAEEAYNQPDQNFREEPEPEHREVAYYENSEENVEPEHRQDAYYQSPKNAHVEPREESPEPLIHKSSPHQEQQQFEAIVPEYEEDITILPTHKPQSSARVSNNKQNSHSEPQSEQEHYDYPKSYYSSAPVPQEKSNRIIIKDEPPKPPQEIYKPNDELIEAMEKKQEESEEDFEQAYKNAAYGFPAYDTPVRNVDREKEIYNPANYGVARFHNDFDDEKSQLRQYEAVGDLYPTQMRSNYKDTRDKKNEDYYSDYAESKPQSLVERKKKKEEYYDNYNEHKPQPYYAKDDSDKQQSAKYTVGSSFSYPGAPQQKQFGKFKSRISPLDEYNYAKEKPTDSSAFGTGTYTSKTRFLEPHYHYGFEPIRSSRLLDRELAAMASDHSPETVKKMYKENFYIEKTSTSKVTS